MSELFNKLSVLRSDTTYLVAIFFLLYFSIGEYERFWLHGVFDAASFNFLIVSFVGGLLCVGLKDIYRAIPFFISMIFVLYNLLATFYYDFFNEMLSVDYYPIFINYVISLGGFDQILAVLMVFLLFFVAYLLSRVFSRSTFKPKYAIYSFFAFIFMQAAIVNGFHLVDDDIYYRNDFSPVGFAVREILNGKYLDEIPSTKISKEIKSIVYDVRVNDNDLPSEMDPQYFQKIFDYSEGESINPKRYPIYRQIELGEFQSYNIIVIVMESVRASEMGLYGAEVSTSPFIDSLAESAIVFDKNYATNIFTVKSEMAINCSMLDSIDDLTPSSMRGKPLQNKCLPMLLEGKGYDTFWFHGYTSEFYRRDGFFPKLGFEKIYDKSRINSEASESLPEIGWGISDEAVLGFSLQRLEQQKKPFYAEILTLSNHYPFKNDWGIDIPNKITNSEHYVLNDYRSGIYYTDYSIKMFFEKFNESKLAENTIVVITGDHGSPTYDSSWSTKEQKEETLYRSPLIIVTPEREPRLISMETSHLDIAPTLLGLLGGRHLMSFMGVDVLSKPNVERIILRQNGSKLEWKSTGLDESGWQSNFDNYSNLLKYLRVSEKLGLAPVNDAL